MKTNSYVKSDCLKREIQKVKQKISKLKTQILQLEKQKFDLMSDLRNTEFEEKSQTQFASRFEVDSFNHWD